MAGEQTVTIAQATYTTVKVVVNAIGSSSGSHVPLVIDTSTTRLDGRSEVPTVYYPTGSTGIAEIRFSVASSSLTEFTTLICKVNGTADSVAFSEYAIPIKVLASEAQSSAQIATNVWSESESTYTLPIYSGSFGARLAAAFDPAVDTVARVTLVDTTTTNTDMRGTDGANTVAPDNASIAAILTDTGTTIPASISSLNNFDPSTDQVIVSVNNDKTGYALSSAANDAIGAAFLSYTLTKGSAGTIERAFWQSLKATQLADGEVSGTPTSSAFDTNLTAVSGAYDHLLLLFTSGSLAGEARPIDSYSSTNGRITLQEPLTAAPSSADEFIIVPSHAEPTEDTAAAVWSYATRTVTSGGGTAPADTYAYFVQGGNEDVFKADVSALASQSSVDTISGNVNSVKSKTDQLSFTVANQVDSNALSGGGGSNVGSGAISHEITVNVGGSPSDGVEVWVTTDSSGTNVVAGTLVTDAFGKASFMLDAGSYYLWAQKSGANFTNPTSFSVS